MTLPPKRNEVDQKFIDRWANRFIEIAGKHGNYAASAWAASFLNKEDLPQVMVAVNKKVAGG